MAPTPGIAGVAFHRVLSIVPLCIVGVMVGCLPAPEPPKLPGDLQKATIDHGKADFSKNVLDRYADLGQITDLRYGRFDNDGEPELAVVGTSGAAFVGSDQRVLKTIHFAPPMLNPVVLIQSKDGGDPVFLGRGGRLDGEGSPVRSEWRVALGLRQSMGDQRIRRWRR